MPESKKGKNRSTTKGITMVVLKSELDKLQARIETLEIAAGLRAKKISNASINKPEKQISGNDLPPREDTKLKMGYEMKIQSMRNAIAILPPNLRVNGKHTLENISRIVGFVPTDEMYEDAYDGIKV